MAFKMKYNKSSFPFKKTEADEALIKGQKEATETVFGIGDKAKVDMYSKIGDEAAELTAEYKEKLDENAEKAAKILTGM